MQTKTNRLTAGFLAIIMVLSILSSGVMTAFAGNDAGQVRVIVENTTYTDAAAPWTGTLVDEWVDLKSGSTMMSCVVDALSANGYTQQGAQSNYISEINGLAAFDGGSMSGWMGTLNDWFTNEGFGAFTAASGKLAAGDEIRIMYTASFGEDLGGSWGNNDKTVKELAFSDGELSPAFSKDIHEYTLSIPEGISSLIVTPTASNKNYQVRTSVDGIEYKRTEKVSVSDGTVITVKCGDPSWPSMNGGGEAQVYTVTVKQTGADHAAASAVISMIDSIGNVTAASKDAIDFARGAYDALTEEQKAIVTNYSMLVEAEKNYAELVKSAGERLDSIYKSVGDYITSLGTPSVGSIGGEWMAIGLARSGRRVPDGYYENVVKYVKEHINGKEQLHRAKSTDNSRVIMALTALGYDVTNVDGHNLLLGLADMKYVKKQGINGPIWALIAFDSHDYDIPAGDVTRDSLISVVLDAQLQDGGWALSGAAADADMTAMAIQALAPYYETNTTAKIAIDSALDALSVMQTTSGGFQSWGTMNAESCAQVMVALTALGIDPQTDARFIKNGCSVVDALLEFYTDGGFRHTMDGELNGMATEQGYYALAAYARLKDGKTSLYDMSDVTIGSGGVVIAPPDDDKKPGEGDQDGSTSDPSNDNNPGESTSDPLDNNNQWDGQTTPDSENRGGQSAKPSDNNATVQSPQTGDRPNIVVYFGLIILSLAVLTVTAVKKRKETQE